MNVDLNNKEKFIIQTNISLASQVDVQIIDRVEGNIDLTICLKADKVNTKSITKFIIRDAYCGEIQIINADLNKYTRAEKPIGLGTYKNKYNLYVDYLLEPSMSDGKSPIRLKFYVEKK